jgi:hypothetical protein
MKISFFLALLLTYTLSFADSFKAVDAKIAISVDKDYIGSSDSSGEAKYKITDNYLVLSNSKNTCDIPLDNLSQNELKAFIKVLDSKTIGTIRCNYNENNQLKGFTITRKARNGGGYHITYTQNENIVKKTFPRVL